MIYSLQVFGLNGLNIITLTEIKKMIGYLKKKWTFVYNLRVIDSLEMAYSI